MGKYSFSFNFFHRILHRSRCYDSPGDWWSPSGKGEKLNSSISEDNDDVADDSSPLSGSIPSPDSGDHWTTFSFTAEELSAAPHGVLQLWDRSDASNPEWVRFSATRMVIKGEGVTDLKMDLIGERCARGKTNKD